jgi:hypothetical protein
MLAGLAVVLVVAAAGCAMHRQAGITSVIQPLVSIHVAPGGDDLRGNGSAAAPFATLARARDAVRTQRRQGKNIPVEVVLASGDYLMADSLELGAEDGGSPEAPVVYRAAKPGRARLLGGRIVRSFAPVADAAILARLSEKAQLYVRVADLKAAGVADPAGLSPRGFMRPITPAHTELFYAGRPMTLAQWPDAGSYTVVKGIVAVRSNDWDEALGDPAAGFMFHAPRTQRWKPVDDLWVYGYWCWDWANSYDRVASLDAANGKVVTAPPYSQYSIRPGQRFYFLNVLEELDQPGEYYIDRAAGQLYYWPPDWTPFGEALVSVLAAPLIRAEGVSHVEFRGLLLEGGRGSGIVIKDGSDVVVRACTVRNMGNRGVVVAGGLRHAVLACEISHTGDAAVDVSGGDRRTLAPAGHRVEDCHLHHFSRWTRTYETGVNASGCGITIAHNLIHDAPHTAILYWGNDITIEANEIYRVCMETGDAGAIYTGRDYTFRGNRILGNFIHHVGGTRAGTCAIYMDDCVSGHEIAGNVVWGGNAVWLGGGRDHIIRDNIFVGCARGIQFDARGMNRHAVWSNMVNTTMRQRLEDVDWRRPPYAARFPELAPLSGYLAAGTGIPPEHNLALRNLGRGVVVESWATNVFIRPEWLKEEGCMDDPAPGFVDPAWGDFRLRPDAPVLAKGIRNPPLDMVGPRSGASPHVRSRLTLRRLDGLQATLRLGLRNDGKSLAWGVMAVGPAQVPYTLEPGETREITVPALVHLGKQTIEAFDLEGTARPARCEVKATGPALAVRPLPPDAVPAPGPDAIAGDPRAGGGVTMDPPCSFRAAVRWTPDALVILTDRGDATPMASNVDPQVDPGSGWSSDALEVRVRTDRVVSCTIWPFAARGEVAVRIRAGTDEDAQAGPDELFTGRPGAAIGPGIEVRYRPRADGTGYGEEVRLPWRALFREVPDVSPGLSFRLGLQLIWGDPSGTNALAAVELNRDPAVPDAKFSRTPAAWSKVSLQP